MTRYAYVLFYRRRNSPVERPAHFHRPGGAESPPAAGAAASQVRARPCYFCICTFLAFILPPDPKRFQTLGARLLDPNPTPTKVLF